VFALTTIVDSAGSRSGLWSRLPWLLRPWSLVLVGCTLLAAWLVFVPLAALFYTAFSEDTPFGPGAPTLANFISAYSDSHIFLLLWNSAVFAVGTGIVTFALGALVAWVVERTDAPGRGLFHTLALLSFALPGLLTTMAWMMILSPNIGWVNAELKDFFGLTEAPFNIYSMGGMIWALSSHYFPLAYLLMGPAFRVLDIRMEEAAVISGANTWQVASRVTLPLLRPAILSTLLLLLIRGLESFEVPRLIGMPARIHVFTTEIQSVTQGIPPRLGSAAALGMTLLLICVLGVYLYRRATANAEAFATVTGKGYAPTPQRLGGWRWPVSILTGLMFLIALGLPLFTLAWQSLFRNATPPSLDVLSGMTLEGYRYILGYPVFLNAVKNSVFLGAMTATFVVAITFLMAWLAQRSLKKYGWILDSLTFIPIAIPSVIIGASILFAYLVLPIPVYNTLWILLIAYVTMYLPYGMRFTSGGIAQLHPELEEVAEVSGASSPQIFARVLLPLLAPVLMAGWLYVFVLAVRELSASIFLAGPGTHVLGTISLTMWEEGGSYGAVCAMGIVQIIPLIVIVMIMRRLEERVSARR
jgi:iron(III) transport system permease protein